MKRLRFGLIICILAQSMSFPCYAGVRKACWQALGTLASVFLPKHPSTQLAPEVSEDPPNIVDLRKNRLPVIEGLILGPPLESTDPYYHPGRTTIYMVKDSADLKALGLTPTDRIIAKQIGSLISGSDPSSPKYNFGLDRTIEEFRLRQSAGGPAIRGLGVDKNGQVYALVDFVKAPNVGEYIEKNPERARDVLAAFDGMLKDSFEKGFFIGDLHLANIKIEESDGLIKIVPIDGEVWLIEDLKIKYKEFGPAITQILKTLKTRQWLIHQTRQWLIPLVAEKPPTPYYLRRIIEIFPDYAK